MTTQHTTGPLHLPNIGLVHPSPRLAMRPHWQLSALLLSPQIHNLLAKSSSPCGGRRMARSLHQLLSSEGMGQKPGTEPIGQKIRSPALRWVSSPFPGSGFGDTHRETPGKRLRQHQLELVASLGAAVAVFSMKVENTDFRGWVSAKVSSE